MTMTPTMTAMCHPVRVPSIVPSYRPRGEPQAEILQRSSSRPDLARWLSDQHGVDLSLVSLATYQYPATLSSKRGGVVMPRQEIEMLEGTLEGIVLQPLVDHPAHGYEITTWLREQGFVDMAQGTVYALLVRIDQRGFVDVEKVPSEKGPPRKVFTPKAAGRDQLDDSWTAWTFLADRLQHLKDRTDLTDRTNGQDLRPHHQAHRRQEAREGARDPHHGDADQVALTHAFPR
jgi:PadR family transcriptional regulator PadR